MRNGKSRSWLDRRHVVGILAAGAAMVFAAGAMAAPDEAARKLLPDDIKQKGLLIAAMPLDFEPFNYLDAQNAQMGLDVEAHLRILGIEVVEGLEVERHGCDQQALLLDVVRQKLAGGFIGCRHRSRGEDHRRTSSEDTHDVPAVEPAPRLPIPHFCPLCLAIATG